MMIVMLVVVVGRSSVPTPQMMVNCFVGIVYQEHLIKIA